MAVWLTKTPSTGVVQNNEVNITGGTLSEDVRGGQSDGSGEVKENTVTISGEKTTVNGTVYGGYSKGSGAVSNNTVTMTRRKSRERGPWRLQQRQRGM